MKTRPNVDVGTNVVCDTSARISTAAGVVKVNPSSPTCASPNVNLGVTGEQINMLDAGETITRVEQLCGTSGITLTIACVSPSPATPPARVHLGSNGVITVSGPGFPTRTVNAVVSPGHYGAVIRVHGSVDLIGVLGTTRPARATIIATAEQNLNANTPSIWIRSAGQAGATNHAAMKSRSSLGLIADGDIIADEKVVCPLRLRAAMIARSGLLSITPENRFVSTGGCTSSQGFAVEGSVVGHYGPFMNTGYPTGRSYLWDPFLYHNPPPMFPVTGPWQVLATSPADLGWFAKGPVLRTNLEQCI